MYTLDVAGETQSYSVTLIANIEGGCADSITKSVVVNAAPDASFTAEMDGRKLKILSQETVLPVWFVMPWKATRSRDCLAVHRSMRPMRLCRAGANPIDQTTFDSLPATMLVHWTSYQL